MIVCSLGYGYIATFFKDIGSNGVKMHIGITDNIKYHKKQNIENITICQDQWQVNI